MAPAVHLSPYLIFDFLFFRNSSLNLLDMEHHDYIDYQTGRSEGVRILTFYFYLNNVTAGGGTRFPKLDITVQPLKGRALVWPSTLDSHPNVKDPRTNHQALPVGTFK